ncbi:MAG: SoxR reducing system RseC family protein [Porticoccaceae bacterium]
MIVESAQITAIADGALWVEAVQRSTCGACVAEKGCGQRLLARLSGKTLRLRVLPGERPLTDYQLGEMVEIGIPEDVVVRGSLLVYILPLSAMLLSAWTGHQMFAVDADSVELNQQLLEAARLRQELAAMAFGFGGLLLGAWLVRVLSGLLAGNERIQPKIIESDGAQSQILAVR